MKLPGSVSIKIRMEMVIGVDEAGRGALAGPVAVGAVLLPADLSLADFPKLKDSKKLSPQKREEWLARMEEDDRITWAVSFSSVSVINERGIVYAANTAATRAAARVAAAHSVNEVRCDAGLKIRHSDWSQRAIVRGDESEPAIAFASIAAKVMRDQLMEQLADEHGEYFFDMHKGYATKLHRDALRRFGPVDGLHRTLFIRNLTTPKVTVV